VFDFPGADPAVPLFGFVFLVALGIDYNIFLMTRVREETLVHGTRRGVVRGLAVTGGVIASAGRVLAAPVAAARLVPVLVRGPRGGVVRGLAVTGGVITSAGLVLAATFAALSVIPILFLAQIAFIVAFGVLLDTFVVRTLLVPALALDIGRAIWWPSRLA